MTKKQVITVSTSTAVRGGHSTRQTLQKEYFTNSQKTKKKDFVFRAAAEKHFVSSVRFGSFSVCRDIFRQPDLVVDDFTQV